MSVSTKVASLMGCAAVLMAAVAVRAATPAELSGIPGLALWLDASDVNADGTVPADGAVMGSWTDKAQGIVFNVHGDTWRRPTYARGTLNGLGSVRFARPSANQAQYLEANAAAIAQLLDFTNTFFVVARSTGGSGDNNTQLSSYIFARPGWHSGLSFNGYPTSTSIDYIRWTDETRSSLNGTVPYTQGDFALITRTVSGSTASVPSAFSLQQGDGAPSAASNSYALWNHGGNANILRIGCAFVEGDYTGGLAGDICEILAFNRALSPQEQQTVRLYLAQHWGMGAFTVSNLAGGEEATASTTVRIANIPDIGSYTDCQFATSDNPAGLDPDGWIPAADAVGSTFTAAGTFADGDILTVYAFLRNAGSGVTNVVSDSIVYSAAPPAAVARDITVMLGKDGTRTLSAADVDGGSHDTIGLAGMGVSPSLLTAAGTAQVTLAVTNQAGSAASAIATVTVIPYAPSTVGHGGDPIPLPRGYFTRLLHLGANFNDHYLNTAAGIGDIDTDQLADFGGEANQRPRDGLAYDSVPGATTGGPLAWTLMDCPRAGGQWEPTEGRDNYIKYWHLYINVPGDAARDVYYRHYNDDALRIWNNGTLMVAHGGAGGEFATQGVLYPGLNSVTIKLQEGGGGDYMRLRITDLGGSYFDDLTCQFVPCQFQVADPVTGSKAFTGTNVLDVVGIVPLDPGAEYQFSASTNSAALSDDAWAYFDVVNPPAKAVLAGELPEGMMSVTLWTRTWDNGTPVVKAAASHPITHTSVAPVAVARDVTLAIDRTGRRFLVGSDIDFGSSDPSGIFSLAVSPEAVYEGENEVTLTVTGNSGLRSTATCTVTGVKVAKPAAGETPELPVTDGLDAWFKGEYLDIIGLSEGAPIPAMHDFSGNNHHMWRWTDDARYIPTTHKKAVNGHTAYRFTGSAVMQNGGIPPGAQVTVFFVAKGSAYQSMCRWQDGGGFLIYPWAENELLINDKNGSIEAGPNAGAETGLVKDRWNIATAVILPGVANGVRTYRNGALVDASTWNNAIGGPNRLMLGAYQLDGEFASCDLAEMLVYTRALSDPERVAVQDYLREKYALGGCFAVADPVTGSTFFTSSSTVRVASVSDLVPTGADVQFSASDDPAQLDPAAWIYVDAENPPSDATVSFDAPASGTEVTLYQWVRTFDNGQPVYTASPAAITYYTGAPTARAKDIAIAIDTTSGTAITPEMIDDGSFDATAGIASMGVSPAIVYGAGAVTLTVVNQAGVADTATAYVSASATLDAHVSPAGDDASGAGTLASPWRSITHAATNVVAGGTVYIAPGTYTAGSGESYPVNGSNLAFRREPGTGDEIVVDADSAANHLFVVDGSATLELEGLTLSGSLGAAILAAHGSETPATVTAADCAFEQPVAHMQWEWDGAVSAFNGSTLDFTRCTFTRISRHSVIRAVGATRLTLDHCLFEGNTNIFATIAMQTAPAARVTMTDTVFRHNWATDGFPHDGAYSAVIYLAGNHENRAAMTIDRCTFIENEGGTLFGLGYTSDGAYRIQNSLFVDNIAHEGEFHGFCEQRVDVVNCTFLRETGGFSTRYINIRIANSIIADTGALTFTAPLDPGRTGFPQGLLLKDTLVWNTPDGEGYNTASSGIIRENPVFENAGGAFDAEGFDARPRPYSPAIDAGSGEFVDTALDYAGNARIADNDGDYVPAPDLGAFESTFHAAPSPAFTVPVPGKLAGYRGIAYAIPVTICPKPTNAVSAAVSYDVGLEGDATLDFPAGSGAATLHFTVRSAPPVDFARISIAESGTGTGVLPAVFDVFIDDLTLTVGGETRFFVPQGETLDIPVALALDGATAPGNVAITTGAPSGTGSNAISWQGDAFIPDGAHASTGFLRIVGGLGENTVTLSSSGLFAETGDNEVVLAFVGYPGWLAVDPANGDDATGLGTVERPLHTVSFALSVVRDGKEVRLLPGTYTAGTETFPWRPGSVSLSGWNPAGETDPAAQVVTGSNTVETLAIVRLANARLANLSVRNTTSVPILAEAATLALEDMDFTQDTENFDAIGAVAIRDDSKLAITRCTFHDMRRFGAVVVLASAYNTANAITAADCTWKDLVSRCAAVVSMNGAGANNLYANFHFTGCVFDNADSTGYYYDDSYSAAAIYCRVGGTIHADRCRFIGCDKGTLFAINYAQDCQISNSLIAGCDNNAGIFDGTCNAKAVLRNCTVTGCAGGFNCCDVTTWIYNSILAGNGAVSFQRANPEGVYDHGEHFFKHIYVNDTIVWDTPTGIDDFRYSYWDGSQTVWVTNTLAELGSNILRVDPILRGGLSYVAGGTSLDGLDARLRASSPAIDAGRNANAAGALDLDGGPRLKIGLPRNADPIVDLGCHESDRVAFGTLFILR